MKISLILPYWDRQEAGEAALIQLAKTYPDLDLEVVIVDDGNMTPFLPPDVPLNIVRVPQPYKTVPKCPATAWNAGAKASTGEIIVLSCIEILHEQPVLKQMADQVKALGPNGYVLAAAWCPEMQVWHCHSSVPVPCCPPGTGIAFCGAMHRELFFKAGGFDEAYREGAGYEDRDFINRMVCAGARFMIRDDLVVVHPKSGATIHWPDGAFDRNAAIFNSKWEKMVHFVCLKAGKAFGAEYVNILRDMVMRNLPAGTPGRFVCLTDDPEGLDAGVEILPLPEDLEKWWGKLYLFKRGLFPDGARVMFMDLDTVIVGSIGKLLEYKGEFATLNDFYQPDRVGPAVMLWRAGDYTASIWDEWVAEGKPRHPMGDLWWIGQLDQGRFAKRADKLQALFPGMFVSFKAHCQPYPPTSAKVVCFHGYPRPHETGEKWVADVWKIGGGGMADLWIMSNTHMEVVRQNVDFACTLQVPHLALRPAHDGTAVLVAGGPSLLDSIEEIKARQRSGQTVIAMNGTAHFLAEHGIKPDWHVLLDARKENAKFVSPPVADIHWVASQCARDVFDELYRSKVILWHPNTSGVVEALGAREADLISSGSTAGLMAIGIAHTQGYRYFHLFGYDSSITEVHHAYPQPMNDKDRVLEAVAGGRTFRAAPWMIAQVNQFQGLAALLADDGCEIHVHGDGLLPHVAHEMTRAAQQQQEAA